MFFFLDIFPLLSVSLVLVCLWVSFYACAYVLNCWNESCTDEYCYRCFACVCLLTGRNKAWTDEYCYRMFVPDVGVCVFVFPIDVVY